MLSIPTGELVGTLADVIPFASQHKELPMLNAVKVEWNGERLHAFATDRFVAGWSRWHPKDDPTADHEEGGQDGLFDDWGSADEPWSFVIPLADAAEIVKIFKLPLKVDRHPLEVDVEYPRVTIRRRPGGSFKGITAQLDAAMGLQFPDVRKLLGEQPMSLLAGEHVCWDPLFLAKFAKVRWHGIAHFYVDGPERLTVVEIGDRFTGAIMPIRENDPSLILRGPALAPDQCPVCRMEQSDHVPGDEKCGPVEQVDGQTEIGD